MPAILNAANEVAVAAFLDNRLPYTGIYQIIDQTLNLYHGENGAELEPDHRGGSPGQRHRPIADQQAGVLTYRL
jgi:hypothetical protein